MKYHKSSLALLCGMDMERDRDYKNIMMLKKQWFKIKVELDKLEFKNDDKRKSVPKRRAIWSKIPGSIK